MRSHYRAPWLAAGLCCALAAPVAAEWAPDGNPVIGLVGDQTVVGALADGAGGAIVTWVGVGSDQRVANWAKRIDATGRAVAGWPAEGVRIVTSDSLFNEVTLTADGAGGAFFAWPALLSDTTATLKVLHLGPDGAAIAGPVAYDAGSTIPFFAAFDAGGGAPFLAWTHDSTGVTALRVMRLSASGEPAPGWPASGVGLGGTRREIASRVVPDGEGGAYLLTASFTGDQVNLFLYRADANGIAPGWPDTGVVIRRDVGQIQYLDYPLVASAGGAIVAWAEGRSGPQLDIFAQRLLPSGAIAPGWPALGLPVCIEVHDQVNPVAIPDGSDGVLIAWLDFRGPNDEYDLYSKRILPSGQTASGWPADGAALCAALGNQFDPTLASDGADGFVAAWVDRRSSSSDIYTQRLRGDGSAVFSADGIPACVAIGDQTGPRIVSDTAGNAIVAWDDARGIAAIPLETYDVYATRITADGGVGSPPLAPRLSLQRPRPNPASGNVVLALDLPRPQRVRARIVDATGRLVRALVNAALPAGRNFITWDGLDDHGRRVRQGLYFVHVQAGDGSGSVRIAMVR